MLRTIMKNQQTNLKARLLAEVWLAYGNVAENEQIEEVCVSSKTATVIMTLANGVTIYNCDRYGLHYLATFDSQSNIYDDYVDALQRAMEIRLVKSN